MPTPVEALDRVFDRVYTSRYNPLYRTGTLAALCLALALATGVYLLFVYEIGRPYESVTRIQGDVLLGRWIRALHRYASDAAAVAVALHVARLVAEGKTWGPRTMAWITGVFLAGMMLVSAVTGFVLVWDQFAQKLAVAGARMLRLLPLFPEPPDRAFVGERAMTSQFFFMNLFLHVAIPLGMVCFLWLHTARLARAAWFPERRLMWGALAGLLLLAIVWPAPLPPAADLLAIPGRVASDWFYGFWLPLAAASPLAGLGTLSVLATLVLAVPWLTRPRAGDRPQASFADPDVCEGCEQCFKDCPYDAIEMVPGRHPEVHPLLAQVQPSLCVSCGICAASCASLAIGPPGRTARDQLAAARALVATWPDAAQRTLLVACRANGGVAERLRDEIATNGTTARFDVECAGTLHPGTVSYLAGHFAGTMVVACAMHECRHREGALLTHARLLEERKPAIPGRIASLPVRLLHHSMGEWPQIVSAIDAFRRGPLAASPPAQRRLRTLGGVAFSVVLLALLGAGSRAPQGTASEDAVLRLGWRLAGQITEHCRDLGAEELAKRPVHMRAPRECVGVALAYDLRAALDSTVVMARRVAPPGLRADRPLSVEEELRVTPGEHLVQVTFTPAAPGGGGRTLVFERRLRFEPGRVILVTSDTDAPGGRQDTLVARPAGAR